MDLYQIRNLLSGGKKIYDLSLKVTFYARVSTDRDEQLNSLDNQVTYFENFIKSVTNWIFVSGYVDEGISGTQTKKRDAFFQMIADAEAGNFNLILTKEVSRFARDTLDSLTNTRDLLAHNVGVYFMSDNINTLEPDSELRLTIMSSIAQEEVRKLSERVKFGCRRSMEKGLVAGNNNFWGYNKDKFNKGRLVIDENEVEIVKLIFNLYDTENIGTTRLGHKLYDEYGIKSKTDKPIKGEVIARMIRNPKYKGYFCAHKETTIDYRTKKRKKFDKEEWLVYKDENIPSIISEEQWERVNEKLEARSKKRKTTIESGCFAKYPLSGKIFCYHDNATYVRGYWIDRKTKEKKVYWGCSNYRKYGKKKKEGCNSPIIYVDKFEIVCRKIVKNILETQDELIKELYDMLEEKSYYFCDKKQEQSLKKKLTDLEKQKEDLIGMRLKKEINATEYDGYKAKIDNEIIDLQKKQKELKKQKQKYQESKKTVSEFKEKIIKLATTESNSLKIAETLFKKIYIETIHEEASNDKKAILHVELNINSYEKSNFSLDQLCLLFNHNKGCSSSYG